MRTFAAAAGLAALISALPLASSAPAQMRREQDAAFAARQSGQLKPLREIESRVIPQMKGASYLGPEYDGSGNYRLKFMRGNSVIWVDVDGRTGTIVGRTGD